MNNLKDFANDTVIKDLALECKQYRELISRLYDDLAAVKKAHKEAIEFNYDLAEENTAIHTKTIAMQERIAALEADKAKLKKVAEVMIDVLAPDGIPDHELSLAVRTLRKPIIKALRAAGYLGGGE